MFEPYAVQEVGRKKFVAKKRSFLFWYTQIDSTYPFTTVSSAVKYLKTKFRPLCEADIKIIGR